VARSGQAPPKTRKDIIMRTARVLVVDDLEGMRALLGEVLGFYGYEVLTAASVPEAEAIRQRPGWGGGPCHYRPPVDAPAPRAGGV
jgi:hypothetical protein